MLRSGVLLLIALAVTRLSAFADPEVSILARVGGIEIKTADIRATLAQLDAPTRSALARDPALLAQYVRTLIAQQLVLQEAVAKRWDQKPEVAAQIEQSRQTTILDTYLQSVSAPPGSFPSDAELRTAYENNKAALLVPPQFRLAQIFISQPQGAEPAAVTKAQLALASVRARLRLPAADFSAIAGELSEDKATAARGGEIGWFTENQVQPELRPKLLTLARDAVSEPIQLADGWHILKMLDQKAAYTPALEAVRTQLTEKLRVQRAQTERQNYLADLLKKSPVTLDERALSQLLSAPVPAPPAPRPAFRTPP